MNCLIMLSHTHTLHITFQTKNCKNIKIPPLSRPDFTTQIGFIKCGLQTVAATVHNKDEFCINMLRGFTSVMEIDTRNEFANKVGMQILYIIL